LVAFEVGRIGEITQLHAIDHKMNYNYRINPVLNKFPFL
jgi:hypothetical protein